MDYKVEAFSADSKLLLNIYQDAYMGMEEYGSRSRKEAKWYLRWLSRRDPEGIWVAKSGDEIIGFIAFDRNWSPGSGEIHELCVRRDRWGGGIGSALISCALNIFASEGFEKVGLWVGERNQRAIKIYEKFGFEPVGRWSVWIRMEKML
jgi:ribosomal protein S18 acetylase RimI-like enzyme